MRRLLAVAGLAAALLPLAPASAGPVWVAGPSFTWVNPPDGCTYYVWGPTYIVNFPPPGSLSVRQYSDAGYSVTCP